MKSRFTTVIHLHYCTISYTAHRQIQTVMKRKRESPSKEKGKERKMGKRFLSSFWKIEKPPPTTTTKKRNANVRISSTSKSIAHFSFCFHACFDFFHFLFPVFLTFYSSFFFPFYPFSLFLLSLLFRFINVLLQF